MTKFSVYLATNVQIENWNTITKSLYGSTVYHTIEWLKILEAKSSTKLFLFIIELNGEVYGVFPVFYQKKYKLKFIYSPPPKTGVPNLGPLYCDGLKQKEFENIQEIFIDNILEYFDNRIDYFYLISVPQLRDARQFIWNNFSVSPLYSYQVSLKRSKEDIFKSFSSQVRTDIRRALKNKDLIFKEGGLEEMLQINNFVKDRYKKNGRDYSISSNYLTKIYNQMCDYVYIYCLYYKDKLIAGLILLSYNNVLSHWIGGTPPIVKQIGANELLHWKAIEFGIENKFECYELVGANTKHLCRYKVKYNPNLIQYYFVRKRNFVFKIVEKLYLKFRA